MERVRIEYDMEDSLPKCIGYIDGSHIVLEESPVEDPESYYTRKQRYAVQLQAVCDNNHSIRNIFVWYPGSVHDARVFANSDIGGNLNKYLSNGQWIAGDSAYPNSQYVVTPFRNNATTGTTIERRKFNKYFSSHRVKIECTFGVIKEVFSSLKGLRIRIKNKKSHKLVCQWITSCCILYNIIRDSIPKEDYNDYLHEEIEEADTSLFSDSDEVKRIEIFNFVCNKFL